MLHCPHCLLRCHCGHWGLLRPYHHPYDASLSLSLSQCVLSQSGRGGRRNGVVVHRGVDGCLLGGALAVIEGHVSVGCTTQPTQLLEGSKPVQSPGAQTHRFVGELRYSED